MHRIVSFQINFPTKPKHPLNYETFKNSSSSIKASPCKTKLIYLRMRESKADCVNIKIVKKLNVITICSLDMGWERVL